MKRKRSFLIGSLVSSLPQQMKKLFTLLLLINTYYSLSSQILYERPLHDKVWLFGGKNIRLTFTEEGLQKSSENRDFNFDATNASICNQEGDLEFYTNGIRIANATHDYIENGYRINPGIFTDDWEDLGNPIIQGALILQQPLSDSLYHLFYAERDYNIYIEEIEENVHMGMRLHHGLIDMSANEGAGIVLDKDFPLIADTLDVGKITACRHGNGRDWWVLVPYLNANEYHRFLLTPDGIEDYGVIVAGEGMRWGLGQAVFSPDGTTYVNYSLYQFEENYLGIYDFDRCTGELVERVIIPNDIFAFTGGVAISENNRFLYESSYNELYQIDLKSLDGSITRERIAEYDGFYNGNNPAYLATTFGMPQLAPDGRILVGTSTSALQLHVIEHPNKKGVASDFLQHSIALPNWNQRTMPNFPYYGLGPLDGSPCDTLGINNPMPTAAFEYTADSLGVSFFDGSHYAEEWLWDFGDGSALDTLQHPVHEYATEGIYEVCLMVSNVTGSHSFCDSLYIGLTAGEYVYSPNLSVRIAPNPVETNATIHLEGFEQRSSAPLVLSIQGVQGRVLQQQMIDQPASIQTLDCSHLASGLYFYRIQRGQQLLASGKLVKQ